MASEADGQGNLSTPPPEPKFFLEFAPLFHPTSARLKGNATDCPAKIQEIVSKENDLTSELGYFNERCSLEIVNATLNQSVSFTLILKYPYEIKESMKQIPGLK